MRCGEIAVLGLTSHPRYRGCRTWREASVRMVNHPLDKRFDFWVVELLGNEDARSVGQPWVPRLIRIQRPTGMWKIRDAKRISCGVLLALRHARLLGELLKSPGILLDHDYPRPVIDHCEARVPALGACEMIRRRP